MSISLLGEEDYKYIVIIRCNLWTLKIENDTRRLIVSTTVRNVFVSLKRFIFPITMKFFAELVK